jgi:two-component system sensor histidine kinase MtrB
MRRITTTARRCVALWRRSLQVRIVAATLLLSGIVVIILGAVIMTQVRDGLVRAKVTTSLAQAEAGFAEARTIIAAAETSSTTQPSTSTPGTDPLLREVMTNLCGGAGPDVYQVLMLNPSQTCGTSNDHLLPSSVPQTLSNLVQTNDGIAYVTAQLIYGPTATEAVRSEAGLLFGEHLTGSHIGSGVYLYYAFPFSQEQKTLDLLQLWLIAAGVLLVLALAAIAWMVTRQVVTPVRLAAGIAERLAAGNFEERMRSRGTDDLARLAMSFNEMADNLQNQILRLEELSRVQRRFVSDVSHELRTPLTTVRMAADLMHEARESFDPAVARAAELLQAQLDRFEELLTDLLEISRFDAGAAVLEPEPIDLREVVGRAVEAARPLAERKGSQFEIVAPPEPCIAEVDGRRIERVLRNLVVNAVEHGEGRNVVVRVAMSEDAVAAAVRDYGVGLKPGETSLVFNRFWRADPARARTSGGTGLGLAIALEDARLHHGWLQAWGEPGGGSQFRLTLPRVVGAELLRSPIPLEPDDSRHRTKMRARERERSAGENRSFR